MAIARKAGVCKHGQNGLRGAQMNRSFYGVFHTRSQYCRYRMSGISILASHAHADAPSRPSSAALALSCIISPTVWQRLTNSPWAWLTKLLFCSRRARGSIHEACGRACKQLWAVAPHLNKRTRFKMLGNTVFVINAIGISARRLSCATLSSMWHLVFDTRGQVW